MNYQNLSNLNEIYKSDIIAQLNKINNFKDYNDKIEHILEIYNIIDKNKIKTKDFFDDKGKEISYLNTNYKFKI